MKKDILYRPLPEKVTIKPSEIEGLGLFCIEPIEEGIYLGVTHVGMGTTLIRTPLGGFINHSEAPNCELRDSTQFGGSQILVTVKPISEGEELTLTYNMYDPTSPASSIG